MDLSITANAVGSTSELVQLKTLAIQNIGNHFYLLLLGIAAIGAVVFLFWTGRLNGFRVGPFGASNGTNSQNKQKVEIAASLATQHQLDTYAGAVLTEEKRRIQSELQNRNYSSDGEKIDVLTMALADAQLCLRFERIYNAIWGGQIVLIDRANSFGGRITLEGAHQHFDDLKKSDGGRYEKATFDEFVSFPIKMGCLSVVENETANGYEITEFGKLFLVYLTNRQMTRYKIPY